MVPFNSIDGSIRSEKSHFTNSISTIFSILDLVLCVVCRFDVLCLCLLYVLSPEYVSGMSLCMCEWIGLNVCDAAMKRREARILFIVSFVKASLI